jgi:hypothetical protein
MEHLCGAFKVNSARVVRAVKETGQPGPPLRPAEIQTTKIRAINLAKLRRLHKKQIVCRQSIHFFGLKNKQICRRWFPHTWDSKAIR